MQANRSWPLVSPSSNGHTRDQRWLRRCDLLFVVLSILLLLFVAIPTRLVAQTTSVVEGTVLDTWGQAIVDAEITVSGPVLAREIKISSDMTGSYRVPGLQPGSYHLHVAKPGFAVQVYQGLAVTVNHTWRCDQPTS